MKAISIVLVLTAACVTTLAQEDLEQEQPGAGAMLLKTVQELQKLQELVNGLKEEKEGLKTTTPEKDCHDSTPNCCTEYSFVPTYDR